MVSDDAAPSTSGSPDRGSYRVADLVIDADRACVSRGGTEIQLSPRSVAFLLALVRAAPEVLSPEQLMDRVWPGLVVGPETISQRVKILREGLGDSARAPRYIAGVRGRGYRMAAPVVRLESCRKPATAAWTDLAAAPKPWVWLLGAGLLLLVAVVAWNRTSTDMTSTAMTELASSSSARVTVAMLPFADMGPAGEQEHFSEGLAEELVDQFARSPELQVIARTSPLLLDNHGVDTAAIARRLGVTHVLEGGVQRGDDRIRITARLTDVSTSSRVWSQTYERALGDIAAVQQEVAASAARALEVMIEVNQARRAAGTDLRAYESYLRARFFYDRRAEGDLDRAKQYYLEALAFAPDDAKVWAGLAGVYGVEFGRGGAARADALAKQREAAQKALALDPELSEAHTRMSHYFRNAGDIEAAVREHREALALDPQNPLALSDAAGSAFLRGHLDEAIELQQRAVSADPPAFIHQANLAGYLAGAGRLEEAKAALLRALELNPEPTPADAADGLGHEGVLARWMILLGDFDEASALVERLPSGPDKDQCMVLIEYARGRPTMADAALERFAAVHQAPLDALRVAEMLAYRGRHDRAFQWLQVGLERIRAELQSSPEYPDGRWRLYHTWLRGSPFLRPLSGDPRWERLFEAADSSSPTGEIAVTSQEGAATEVMDGDDVPSALGGHSR